MRVIPRGQRYFVISARRLCPSWRAGALGLIGHVCGWAQGAALGLSHRISLCAFAAAAAAAAAAAVAATSFGSAPHICFGACADIIFFYWARFILAARLCFDARAAVVVYLYLSIRCHCAGLVGYRGGWSARHR